MTTTQHDTATLYSVVTTLLRGEENTASPIDLSTWQSAQMRRTVLSEYVRQLEQATGDLRSRLDDLPILAPPHQVHWAQALLAFPNLAFLEVDTDSLGTDADLLRIALLDQTGAVLFDQLIQPRRPISPQIAHLTGIPPERLADAPRVSEIWQQVQAAFAGRYALSFNLAFDQQQLAGSASRCDLPALLFIGECLMQRAQEYYGLYRFPKLADLCEGLGSPLPDHPQQDALDRARGQVHLLRAMAQGITHAQALHQVPDEAELHDSGDPFLPDFPDENE